MVSPEVIRLVIDNQNVIIQGAPSPVIRELEKACSYLVAGHWFAPAFKAKRWDGREHLLVFKKGRYIAPIGLLPDIRRTLREEGVPFQVKRRKQVWPERVDFAWNPEIKLRDYQKAAVDAFCAKPEPGRGMLKMPIRSGKTKTAAGVIHRLGVRTLFMVPSQMLLYQTAESLRESLLDCHVGMIGDGHFEIGDVTVATVQSLDAMRGRKSRQCDGNRLRDQSGNWIKGKYQQEVAACGRKKCDGAHGFFTKPDPRWAGLLDRFGLVVFDECHHLRGDSWHKTMMAFRARYRLGLSATIYLENASEMERGVIWLKACCGDIKYEVSTSYLISKGYLMRQRVLMYEVDEPDRHGAKWSGDLRNQCVYENPIRNQFIVTIARHMVSRGANVMIVTNRLNQIALLADLIDKTPLEYVTLTGRDSQDMREARVDQFKRGKVPIIVGTVFGEGVDIPEVEVVINAEGGKDMKSTVQRMRNMTPSKGKTLCVLVDFWDTMNKYFHDHSKARLKTYESELAFSIRKMWE